MTHDPVRLALTLLVVAVASTLKGTIGFGFPLVAVPLVSTLLGPRVAIPLVALPTLLSNVIVVTRARAEGAAPAMTFILAGLVVGTVAGAFLITSLDPRGLSIVVGAIAILYVVAATFRLTDHVLPSAGRRAAPLIGLLAGLIGGSTGIFAPLLATYLHLLQMTKREFVFWLTVMFFVGNIVQVGSYVHLGLYAGPVLGLALLACLPMAVGTWTGLVLQDRLDPVIFGRVVLALVALASLNLLLRGLLG